MTLGHALAAILASTALVRGVADAGDYKPQRNRLGQPDLEGLWSANSLTRLERPEGYPSLVITEAQARALPPPRPVLTDDDDVGTLQSEWLDAGLALARLGGEIRTSWIVDPPDGRLPYTPEGRARLKVQPNSDGPEGRTNNERCLNPATAGPPMLNGPYNNHWQIVQTPDHVLISTEQNHEARIVHLGDRRHGPPQIHKWMGDSIGWWAGDSLVIETTNFAPEQSMRRNPLAALYLSSEAVVTERFTRVSPTQILYRFAVSDPANFTQVWRGEIPLTVARGPVFEYACHEGNYSMRGILGGARRQEQDAAAAAK